VIPCRILLSLNKEIWHRDISLPTHPPIGSKITLFGDEEGDVSMTFQVQVIDTEYDEGTLPSLDVHCKLAPHKNNAECQKRMRERIEKLKAWKM
jgi:hypothetical protein